MTKALDNLEYQEQLYHFNALQLMNNADHIGAKYDVNEFRESLQKSENSLKVAALKAFCDKLKETLINFHSPPVIRIVVTVLFYVALQWFLIRTDHGTLLHFVGSLRSHFIYTIIPIFYPFIFNLIFVALQVEFWRVIQSFLEGLNVSG